MKPEMKRRKVGFVMKKLIFVLTMLLLAVPAMAQQPVIWAECDVNDGNGVVTIYYDVNDACEIRAFALNISVNDAVIDDAWGESDDYWVYPGTYNDDWSVVAPSGDPGAEEGLGSGSITSEQGSLYAQGENEPCDVGELLTLIVNGDPGALVTVSLAENDTRGGVVKKATPGEDVTPKFIGCSYQTPCFKEGMVDACGQTITAEQVARWVDLGEPCCWCYDCHCKGDVDGNCVVEPDDVTEAAQGWLVYADGYCSDTDYNGVIEPDDITNIADGWINDCPSPCVLVPPEPDGCDPEANS